METKPTDSRDTKTRLLESLHLELSSQERLKRQILDELDPARRQKKGVFEHPAFLLLLGFFLTGVLGTSLSSCWQEGEWNNQQLALQRQRTIDVKYKLIDELSTATADTLAAAEDVLAMFVFDNARVDSFKSQTPVIERWQTASRNWRVQSKALRYRIGIYYRDQAITDGFEAILDQRRFIGNEIANYLGDRDHAGVVSTPAKELQDETLKRINHTVALLTKLAERMIAHASAP